MAGTAAGPGLQYALVGEFAFFYDMGRESRVLRIRWQALLPIVGQAGY
jgi:hypothetical protein